MNAFSVFSTDQVAQHFRLLNQPVLGLDNLETIRHAVLKSAANNGDFGDDIEVRIVVVPRFSLQSTSAIAVGDHIDHANLGSVIDIDAFPAVAGVAATDDKNGFDIVHFQSFVKIVADRRVDYTNVTTILNVDPIAVETLRKRAADKLDSFGVLHAKRIATGAPLCHIGHATHLLME